MSSPDHAELLEPYLGQLQQLPFVRAVDVAKKLPAPGGETPDASIRVRTPRGTFELLVEIKTAPPTRTTAEAFSLRAARSRKPWLLVAPHVPPAVADLLASRALNYIDLAGNVRLDLDDRYIAVISGRKPPRREPAVRGLGLAGYQVIFTLLADDSRARFPIRTLAAEAGVSKTAAADALERLKDDGFLRTVDRFPRLIRKRELLERWLRGFETLVRPRSLIGRFAARESSPEAFERLVEDVLAEDTEWAWGGAAAAFRLTHHYRGESTVLLHRKPDASLPRALRLMPSRDGKIVLMRVRGLTAMTGEVPRTAHPLLVYSELLANGDDREREAAEVVRQQYLAGLP